MSKKDELIRRIELLESLVAYQRLEIQLLWSAIGCDRPSSPQMLLAGSIAAPNADKLVEHLGEPAPRPAHGQPTATGTPGTEPQAETEPHGAYASAHPLTRRDIDILAEAEGRERETVAQDWFSGAYASKTPERAATEAAPEAPAPAAAQSNIEGAAIPEAPAQAPATTPVTAPEPVQQPMQAPAPAEPAQPAAQYQQVAPAAPEPASAYASAHPLTRRDIDILAEAEGRDRETVAQDWFSGAYASTTEAAPEAPAPAAAPTQQAPQAFAPAPATAPATAAAPAAVPAPEPAAQAPEAAPVQQPVQQAQPAAQATQAFQPVQQPTAAQQRGKFEGADLGAALAAIASADADEFAAELVRRHPSPADAELEKNFVAAVVANLVEDAPVQARSLNTLHIMLAQGEPQLLQTFDPILRGQRYDMATGRWVIDDRDSEHPSIAPWRAFMDAGDYNRMQAREAADAACRAEMGI